LDGSHTKYAKSESPKQFGGNTYDAPALRYGGSGRSENKLRPVADFFGTAAMEKSPACAGSGTWKIPNTTPLNTASGEEVMS
jgi:hypothetical protein